MERRLSSEKSEWTGSELKQLVSMDPFQCRMWAHHERLEDYVTEETCREEIDSHSKHGQLIPVLGRSLKNDPWHKVELIYGARRLFVAKHLNTPLLVELREMTDREAVIAMEIENHHRRQASPYERGLCFSNWLRNGLFKSQDEIALAVNLSKSQVSRYLRLSRLPSLLLAAFENPTDVCEAWGLDLMEAWEDPRRQRALARSARALGAETRRPAAREVYRYLMSSATGSRKAATKSVRDEVVRDYNGDALFRISHRGRSVALVLPTERVSKPLLQEIRAFVANVLQDTTRQAPESSEESCKNGEAGPQTWLINELPAASKLAPQAGEPLLG